MIRRAREAAGVQYVLIYDYVDDYPERRSAYREEHLQRVNAARGELVLAGAFAEAPYGAVILFKTEDKRVVERFVAEDPYGKAGIVRNASIRALNVVVDPTERRA